MQNYINILPAAFNEYQLLDTGNGEKLEAFGTRVLRRPEPQALWPPHWSADQWKTQTQAAYIAKSAHTGDWQLTRPMLERWEIVYYGKAINRIVFRTALTGFKHVGLFPEQAVNWEYAATVCRQAAKNKSFPVLNLFAYTGGLTLACAHAGAQVTHVDAVRQIVQWASENAAQNQLTNIRWIVEDAMAFVRRELRRGNRYHGIALDPPAYGIGTKGERWQIAEKIDELIALIAQLLAPPPHFLIFNAYSLGYSPLILANLIQSHFPAAYLKNLEIAELCLTEISAGRLLPCGVVVRFSNL